MGGELFLESASAVTACEAFNVLVRDKTRKYGENPYNGTISTCCLGRCMLKLSGKDYEGALKEAQNHAVSLNYGEKGVADYIEIGPINYAEFALDFIRTGTPTTKQGYKLWALSGTSKPIPLSSVVFKTLGEALSLIKSRFDLCNKYVFNTPSGVIVISHANSEQEVVYTIRKKAKRAFLAPPSSSSAHGNVILPVYTYVFYGWAHS